MASLSVKDRAKMFGNLASPNDAEKDRSYRRIGNKVSSSPFRSPASPKDGTTKNAKFSPSPFSSRPKNASIREADASSQNLSQVFSKQKEKKQEGNNMEWPDEDGIPVPGASTKNTSSIEHKVPTATSASSKFSNSSSPFKVLNNENTQGKVRHFDSSKSKFEVIDSPLKTGEQRFEPKKTITIDSTNNNQNRPEASKATETKGEKSDATPVESNNTSQDPSMSNPNENQIPVSGNNKNKSTRAMRLQKARRASPAPNVSQNLKQSLQAAKVVMQEEKSDSGASDASSRSSLSNKELSNIAKRALKKSNDLLQKKGEFNTKSLSSQEARRALLNLTASKQKKTIQGTTASERLGRKANRAVAMKNSTKEKAAGNSQNNMDIEKALSTHSNDSSRSRRMQHPAFAGRPTKSNLNSAHILASFQKFNAARQSFPTKQKKVTSNKIVAENPKKRFEDDFEPTFSDDESIASLEQEETMHSVREMPVESMHSMRDSMHSMSGRQERSMHSMRMGRMHITSKSCNDTVISSLSGNTQSLQSTMSQSVVSKIKSPVNKSSQKTSFLLDPTPEHSSNMNKSELVGMLSPGPSNRSGHSSIISASPRADYRGPSVQERVNTSFMDTLEEKPSSSQESNGNSAELLDAAVDAAVEDMEILDSPRTNPSLGSKGNSFVESILPNSSSGRSHSPPGFVFKDTEESDFGVPPAPVGKEFAPIVDEEDKNSSEKNDGSIGFQTKTQEASEVNGSDNSNGLNPNNDIVYQKQGSTSTKQTVSTSIRSGISSIQNGPRVEITKSDSTFEGVDRETYEGSTSIRTGLSGLQSQKDSNEMENSISIHTNKNEIIQNNETTTTTPSEGREEAKIEDSVNATKPSLPQYPDTINEENEVKSTQKSSILLNDENTSFSGLKVRPTATTDGSSGTTTDASTSSDDPSRNDSAINANANILPPIQTEGDAGEEMSNNGFSLLSPGSRSSRLLKNGFGKSIGNAIKTVLAKASPRGSGPGSARSSQNDDCGSLFSDDDDIFGGLEVEQDEKVVKPVTPKKQKIEQDTPRQKNFMSNEKKEGSISRRTNESISQRTNRSLSRRTNESFSRRTNESLSRRANESFSRRANGSLSRRTNQSNSRKSIEKGTNQKIRMPNTPSQQKRAVLSPSPAPVVNAASPYSNDRSGMIVDESEVVHKVNSDITSSLIGGPVSGPSPFQKAMREASKLIDFGDKKIEEKVSEEIPESQYSKEETAGESFTLLMDSDASEQKVPESLNGEKSEQKEEETMDEPMLDDEEEEEDKQIGSMFLNFGCGLVDPCSGFANLCTQGNKVDDDNDDEIAVEVDDGDNKDGTSDDAQSQLTPLEKKVWNAWDQIKDSALDQNKKDEESEENKKDDNDNDKKQETVQDKLINIASKALSPQVSVGKSTLMQDDQTKTTDTTVSEATISASGSSESESGFTKESDSGASGNSFGNSLTSGESSFSQDYSRGTYSSASFSSGEESDAASDDPSYSSETKMTAASGPSAGPILLSFSQRSLMEKFSKQLTAVGIQVLKLNTRKQWQTRYFTVSTEQIALSAHETISKTGEIAQCPKALLWLKKFNPKNGGYGIINIDKNGHGGMLLVDLVDVQVSESKDDVLRNPIPKKLQDAFENSVLVTLKYKMKGILRSIEFRCRDGDEAQFLCTCLRVIRDLLRRERSLRQKLSKRASNKK